MKKHDIDALRSRKGPLRMADIQPPVLKALNEGVIETKTLVEWLAIDIRKLVLSSIDVAGLDEQRDILVAATKDIAEDGVEQRTRRMGTLLYSLVGSSGPAFEALATHPSDMVRSWAAMMVCADPSLSFKTRLARMKRFAADTNMSARECAWGAWRPWFAREIESGLKLLNVWVRNKDANVRRCAIEGTRPRGVWTQHISALKAKPELAMALLDPLHDDPSRYVQNAVANWINDASKDQPKWAKRICAKWSKQSGSKATAYIVNRALRTLRKTKPKELR
jgi:3-methyladenine DNA glycosylase AlkC